MNYKTRMKKGLKGPAFVIVPISESLVDRAVFNGVIRNVLRKGSVETQAELKRVAQIKYHNEEKIVALLEQTDLMVSDPPKTGELTAIENYICKHFTWKPEDERPIGIGDW